MDFEKLIVFQKAMDFAVGAYEMSLDIPRGHSDLISQLRRSSSSVPLNIAEGAGEWAPAEKARIYRIAKRSATEAVGTILFMERLKLIPPKRAAELKSLAREVVSMLTKMILDLEVR